jgi:hypothetical protein
MENKYIRLYFDSYDEFIFLPLAENISKDSEEGKSVIVNGITEVFVKDDVSLKKVWEELEWGYYEKPEVELLTEEGLRKWESESSHMLGEEIYQDIVKDSSHIICEEFDVVAYKSLSIKSDLYLRPFDEEPEDKYYCSSLALDCTKGAIYEKDFCFFTCESCERCICEQNPSNGWDVQYRVLPTSEFICIKCLEDTNLEDGVSLDSLGTIEEPSKKVPYSAMFFNTSDLLDNGWVPYGESILIGSGRQGFGHADVVSLNKSAFELIRSGKKVNMCINSLAIGGLGGYIQLYVK